MPYTPPRAVTDAAQRVVTVINTGNRQIKERYNGKVYLFPPRSAAHLSSEVAYTWFGDPSRRTNMRDWNEEVHGLMNRVGGPKSVENPNGWRWEYQLEGNFYVREWGRGKEYYAVQPDKEEEVYEAFPLENLMLDELDPSQALPGEDLQVSLERAMAMAHTSGDE